MDLASCVLVLGSYVISRISLYLGSRILSNISHLVSWLSDLVVSSESYCTSGLELDQLTQPSSANLRRLLTRSREWGRYLQTSIDPVGVEIGAAFVAHGDQRRSNCQHTHSLTHSHTLGKKLLLVK